MGKNRKNSRTFKVPASQNITKISPHGNNLKKAENSNRRTNRKTVPLEFLSLQAKTTTFKRNKKTHGRKTKTNGLKTSYLEARNENQSTKPNSNRLPQINGLEKVVFSQDLGQKANDSWGLHEAIGGTFSKGVFREILTSKSQSSQSNILENFGDISVRSFYSKKTEEEVCNIDFCSNFGAQLQVQIKHDSLVTIKENIFEEILSINKILAGEKEPNNMEEYLENQTLKRKHTISETSDCDYVLVPENKWVFQTPPTQKINLNQYTEKSLEPAVISFSEKTKKVYEIKKNINFNFTDEKVVIDNRYLTKVAEVPTEVNCDSNVFEKFDGFKVPKTKFEGSEKKNEHFKFEFNPEKIEFNHDHFLTLTNRPKKIKQQPRISTLLQSRFKNEAFENSTPPNTSNVGMDYENDPDFSVLDLGEPSQVSQQQFSFVKRSDLFNENNKFDISF